MPTFLDPLCVAYNISISLIFLCRIFLFYPPATLNFARLSTRYLWFEQQYVLSLSLQDAHLFAKKYNGNSKSKVISITSFLFLAKKEIKSYFYYDVVELIWYPYFLFYLFFILFLVGRDLETQSIIFYWFFMIIFQL